jgi:transcriptional regulator with XRE-family HTH domain
MAKKSPNPIDKYVGLRIRMQRLLMKMSQQKLAGSLGLTFQQVQKYEKGTNRVGASRLQHIASILRVPVAFFFEGAPSGAVEKRSGPVAPVPDYVSGFLATTDGLALLKAFIRVGDPKLRRSIVNLVEEVSPSGD